MQNFATHTLASAPVAAKPALEQAQAAYGFIPNLLGNMATAPALLEGYLNLAESFSKTELTATEQQIVLMTNNRLNGCNYCMAAHSSIAEMSRVPADVIEALRNNEALSDPKLEALRQFAELINTSRGWPQESDVEALLEAGYSQQTVLEVLVGTSLKLMSNYTNHITHTKLDPAFSKYRWQAVE